MYHFQRNPLKLTVAREEATFNNHNSNYNYHNSNFILSFTVDSNDSTIQVIF